MTLLDFAGALNRRLRVGNLAAALAALVWLTLIAVTLDPKVSDFFQYHQAARNLAATGDPYSTTPDMRDEATRQAMESGNHNYLAYPNPPLLAYLLRPTATLDARTGQYLWLVLNCAMLAGFVWAAISVSGSALARQHWGLVLLGFCLAPPTRLGLQLGQLHLLLALLLTGSWLLARRPALSGGMLALAGLLKLFPGMFGVFFLLYRPRQVAYWSLFLAISITAASLAVYGFAPHFTFVDKVLLGGYYPYAAEFNVSLVGFWRRLLQASSFAIPLIDAPALATALIMLSSAGVLAGLVLGHAGSKDEARSLRFGLWVCAMLLLTPVNGAYNLALLLLPLLIALRALELRPSRTLRNWLILATALVCVPSGWAGGLPELYQLTRIGWGQLLLTPQLYGLLIYFALLLALMRRGEPA